MRAASHAEREKGRDEGGGDQSRERQEKAPALLGFPLRRSCGGQVGGQGEETATSPAAALGAEDVGMR